MNDYVIRADERFRSEHNGISSWHTFSAGAHYDPSRLGVGPLIGFDEHVLAPGAGFAAHAHRGVEIVSWVISGALRHQGERDETLVLPGQVLMQACGEGIHHTESNASDGDPLRMIQMTLASGLGLPSVRLASPPVSTEEGRLSVARASTHRIEPPCFVHVVSGTAVVGDHELETGDSLAYERRAPVYAHGEVLMWSLGRWN